MPSSKVLPAPEPLGWAQLSCETLQMVLELGANRVTKQLAQSCPAALPVPGHPDLSHSRKSLKSPDSQHQGRHPLHFHFPVSHSLC